MPQRSIHAASRARIALLMCLIVGMVAVSTVGLVAWKMVIIPWQSRKAIMAGIPSMPDLAGQIPRLAQEIRRVDAEARNNPFSAEKMGSLAMTYHANGLLDQARAAYQVAVDLTADDFRWNYYLAVVEESLGNYRRAIELLENGVRLQPRNVRGHSRLGHLLLRSGKVERAKGSFQLALRLDADYPSARLGMARILALERDWDGIIAKLEPVVETYPFFGPALRLLDRAYRETGQANRLERTPLEESTVEDVGSDPLLDVLADRSALAFSEGDPGRGKTLLAKRCTRCHAGKRIQDGHKTWRQWLRTIRKMQTLAGQEWLNDEEAADILAYLSSRSENAPAEF